MSNSILFVGTATFDYIALVEKLPGSDERIEADIVKATGGGPAAGAAVAANTLGAPVSIVTAVGDDESGSSIVQDFNQRNIGTESIQVSQRGYSSTSLIQVEKYTGDRSIIYYGGVLKEYDLEQFPEKKLNGHSIVHADGNFIPLTLKAFKKAKERGAVTSLDGGNISKENVKKLLPFTDIFITDEKSMQNEFNTVESEESFQILAKYYLDVVVITKGKNGCVMRDSLDKMYYLEGKKNVNVIDTTGAGDNFHGAFVFGKWKGLSNRDSLYLANDFAAYSCQGLGGRSSLLSYDEWRSL